MSSLYRNATVSKVSSVGKLTFEIEKSYKAYKVLPKLYNAYERNTYKIAYKKCL